jgi:hypothetical protein
VLLMRAHCRAFSCWRASRGWIDATLQDSSVDADLTKLVDELVQVLLHEKFSREREGKLSTSLMVVASRLNDCPAAYMKL